MNKTISDDVAALASWYLGDSDNCFNYAYISSVKWFEGTEWTDVGAVNECNINHQIRLFEILN